MIVIAIYKVKSLSSKKESFYLILTFIFLLLISTIILKLRVKPLVQQIIRENEISSYKSLNNIEIEIYSEILNSFVEIDMLKNENGVYPTILLLEKENIPPYYKDNSWKKKGSIEWKLIFHDDIPLYIGQSQNLDLIGNFLIEIDTNNLEKSKIYYFKEKINDKIFENNYESIKPKLKCIIPYTGKNEKQKIKEEE